MLLNSGWNQLKYRPHGININKDNSECTIEFLVEPVSYYYSFFTEQGVDYKLYPDKNITLRDILSPYLYSTISWENCLIKEIVLARDNPIANTLGVEILLIAKDGTILIKRRSKTVAVEKEKLDPGISGGLDWNTLMYHYKSSYYRPIKLSDAIKHELAENEELSPESIENMRLYVISITRNLRYMGKMNFLLLGYAPVEWDKLYNLDKMEATFETRSIIGIRIKELWKETTDNGNNVDFCRLLKYVREGFIQYIVDSLDKCEKEREEIANCPVLFEGHFSARNNTRYHVDVRRILFDRSKKGLSWNRAKPIDISEARKYARYRDFSAVFLVIIRSLYDAHDEYCPGS